MKYILSIILLIIMISCQDEVSIMFIIKVDYESGLSDTLRIITDQDAKFYLKPYHESNYLGCSEIGPIVYNVSDYKLLN